jgi:hypothetical protein
MTAVRNARLQERSTRAQSMMRDAIETAKQVLTAEQWNMLPAWVIHPPENRQLERRAINVSVSGPGT